MALYDDFKKTKDTNSAPLMNAGPLVVPKPTLYDEFRSVKDKNGAAPKTDSASAAGAALAATLPPEPSAPTNFDTFKSYVGAKATGLYKTLTAQGSALDAFGKAYTGGASALLSIPDRSLDENIDLAKGTAKELGAGFKAFGDGLFEVVKTQIPQAVYTAISAGMENDRVYIPTGNPLVDATTRTFDFQAPIPLKDTRKKVAKWSNDILEYLGGQQQKDLAEAGITADSAITDPRNFGYQLGNGVGTMALAIGTTIVTKNPELAAGVLGWMQGSQTYTDSKASLAQEHPDWTEDQIQERSLLNASIDTVGQTVLEKFGLDALFRSYGKGALYKASANAITETLQEVGQQVWTNAVAKFGYDKTRKIVDQLVETIAVTAPIGFLGGAGLSSHVEGGEAPMDADTQILDKVARTVAHSEGVPPEDLKEPAKAALEQMRSDVENLKTGAPFKDHGDMTNALADDVGPAVANEGRDVVRDKMVADEGVPVDDNAMADEALDHALALFGADEQNRSDAIAKAKQEVTGKTPEEQAEQDEIEASAADAMGDTTTEDKPEPPSFKEREDVPDAVEEELGNISDSQAFKDDWEENHADEVGKLATRLNEIQDELKGLKGVKNKELRGPLEKEGTQIAGKLAGIENDFIDKYRKLAEENVKKNAPAKAARDLVESQQVAEAQAEYDDSKPSEVLAELRETDSNTARTYMNDFWQKNAETVAQVKGKGAVDVLHLEAVQYDDGTWGVRSDGSVGDSGWGGPFGTDTFASKEEAIASEVPELVRRIQEAMKDGSKRAEAEGAKALKALAPFMEGGTVEDDDNDTGTGVRPDGDSSRGPNGGDGQGERGSADTEPRDVLPRRKRAKRGAGDGERSSARLEEPVGEQLESAETDEARAEILADDADERREAEDVTNETIQSLVEGLTQIGDDGEVTLAVDYTTPEQRKMAALYTGAGGMESKGAEGRGLLDEYYTPENVVSIVGTILSDIPEAHQTYGSYLEPSAGIGAFLYNIPSVGDVTALEINPVAARVLKVLHQEAKVYVKPFESLFMDDRGNPVAHEKRYDTVVGNPPYGAHRGMYLGLGEEPKIKAYDEYFLKRALDLTKVGGHVAMVVPSGFLRSGPNKATEAITRIGELIDAYRLPNGAFPTTSIGTDIVVFKRIEGGWNMSPLVGDNFFRDHPEKVLGTPTEKKGRRGEMEPYVEGTMEEASDTFYANRNRDFAEKQSDDDEVITGTQDELDESYKEDVYEEVRNEAAPTPAYALGQAVEFSEEPQTIRTVLPMGQDVKYELEDADGKRVWTNEEGLNNKGLIPENTTPKKAKKAAKKGSDEAVAPEKKGGLLDLSKYSTASAEEKELWTYTTSTGELRGDFNKAHAFEYKGEWYNRFNYLQGDIYEKLDALEESKSILPADQYARQKEALDEVLPPRVGVDRMSISPNSRFAAELLVTEDGVEKPLTEHFLDWLSDLPISAFGDSNRWAIKGYIQNQAVRGGDKQQNEQERRTRRLEGDRLFKLYLNENLSGKSEEIVEEQYNRRFNAYHRPDYRNVPLVGKISDTFHGSPLEIKDVQLQGVGFLVNRGVGLLAHDVGIGKTMQSILAINETMARGWSKKPLIVVPSVSVYNQWIAEIKELIPGAKVNELANLGGDFKGDLATLAIEEGTWSIATEEGFKRLGFSDETYKDLTSDFLDVIEDPNGDGKSKRQGALEGSQAEVQVGKGRRGTSAERSFEDLGFDLLAGDEIHNANHIIPKAKPEKTGDVSEFRAFSVRPSIFGIKMWLASQYVQKHNGGRNTYFASATPFTNNPLEYYSILSLMARERMKRMGLLNVNDFMTAFMEITTQHEFKADGSYVEKGEVRSFKNYQQFQKLLTEFIDFRDGAEAGVKRPERASREYMVGETPKANEYKELAQAMFEDKQNAGPLKAIGELRAIAFSPFLSRFYEGGAPSAKTFMEGSPKLLTMAKLIKQSLKDNPDGGHLVYSPVGVEYFPLIKQYLDDTLGLPEGSVEIISGATPKPKRSGIQAAFNAGKVKVVLGSDAIQEGVNLQQNTTDLYVLSLPWNFTSLRQVIGRGWRQGNRWPRIRVNSLFTENSIDVFLSQKLQTKEKRYAASLEFKGDTLDVGDIDFEEMKLDLITDPVRRTELDYQLRQQELELEIKRKIADQGYKNRRAVEYMDAKKKLAHQKELAAEYDWAKKSLPEVQQRFEDVRTKLTEKGIDVNDLEKELAAADAEVEVLRKQIETLNAEKAEAIEKAEAERTPETGTRETDYAGYVRARAEDNASFYKGGPLFERSYRALDGSLPGAEWARHMDTILSPEEVEAVALGQTEGITDENRDLLKSAYKKYLDFVEKAPAFERAAVTTPILEELGDRATVSRQFIADLTKKPDTKKAEREVVLEALAEIAGDGPVNVQEFGEKVVSKLLPLTAKDLGDYNDAVRYDGVVLPEEQRGPVYRYEESIYESPIKTNAAKVHFGNESDHYFAHVRREDMSSSFDEDGQPEYDSATGVRRIIEVQSDLFQKGRLEDEYDNLDLNLTRTQTEEMFTAGKSLSEYPEIVARMKARKEEIKKLDPYRNEWWKRIVREEIQKAAEDSITELQFPTGETAMKIEGLGRGGGTLDQEIAWGVNDEGADYPELTEQNMEVGVEVTDNRTGVNWLITDVGEDGKFKAVSERFYETVDTIEVKNGEVFSKAYNTATKQDELVAIPESEKETFDVSGAIDETNPIYRFYEEDMQNFLRRIRPDLKRVTDKQGVEWFETGITSEDEERPVQAFQRTPFETFKYQATTFAEAKATLEAYKKRFKLDFDIDFANVIFTGEYHGAGFERKQTKAYAVTWNNKITLTENVTRTTADHEFVHLVAENIAHIPAFSGISHVDLLKSMNGGKDYTNNEVEALDEKLAIGFENYLAGRAQKTTTVVGRFYQLLKDLVTDFMRAFGADIPVLTDFYDRLARAKSTHEVELETDRLDPGPVTLHTDGSIVMDFALEDKRMAFDAEIRAGLFERLADMEIDDQNQDLTRKDINSLENITAQARDLYLRDPNEFAAAKEYERVSQVRRMNKSALDQKWSKMLAPYMSKELSKDDREKVNRVLMEGDKQGKEFSDAELDGMNLNGVGKEAYKAVRKAFNLAHDLLLQRMVEHGIDPSELEEYMGQREGYMPHKWKYRFVVKTQTDDGKGFKTTEMQDFKTKALANKAWEEMKAANTDDRTRFVLDTLDSLEVDFFSEQRLSFENMKSAIVQARTANDVKTAMIDALRNMVKEKGFGRHYIRRMGIEGYELKSVPELIANYFAGLDGYVTKMDAAPKYFNALSTIDARRQSRFYSWMRDAIAYDMGGTKEWERLKQIAFIYYLANDVSFLVTNATQNFTVGAGELGKYMQGKQFSLKPEAMITGAMKDWWTKNLNAEERKAVESLLLLGELGGEMAAEIMGFKNNPLYTEISGAFSKGLYATTAMVERDVNRVPMFLAARRLFKEQGMTDKEANEKGLEVSEDVHFRYGRQHRPRMMRGSLLGSLFVFNHYMRSFLYQLSRNLTQGEYMAFTRKMLYTALLGGTTSLPFANGLIALFRQIFGTDCKNGDETSCQNELEMSLWQIALQKGLPATVGIDLSGRVGIEIMSVNSIIEEPGDVKSWIGAAGNLLWVEPNPDESGRLAKGINLLTQGRFDDAAGYLLPDMFANPIKAYTGYNWGVRSFSGTPLTDQNGEALKYNPWEAFIRATGFTPTRENLAWDQKSKEFVDSDKASVESSNIRRTIQGQIQRGDYAGARETQDNAVAAGTIPASRDYVRDVGKDTFIKDAYNEWVGRSDNGKSLKSIENGLIDKLYGPDASDLKKNNARKEFAVYRTFGLNDKNAEKMMSAGSNAEKVDILMKLRDSMSDEDFRAFWAKGRKTIDTEAGNESAILISDDLKELYLESRKKAPDMP